MIYRSHYLIAVCVGFGFGIFLAHFGMEDWLVWWWLLGLTTAVLVWFWDDSAVRLLSIALLAIILGYGYVDILPRDRLAELPQNWVVLDWFSQAKSLFILALRQVLPEPQASLSAGLVVGGSGLFSQELKRAFIATGTIHIVAVSGFNITVMLKLFSDWLRPLGRWLAFIFGTLIIVGFIVLVGGQASVVRAGIMGWLFLLARVSFRLPSVRNALFVTGTLMLLQEPGILVKDIGFQLSFLAMLGLVYISPLLNLVVENISKLQSIPRIFRSALVETLAAQIAVSLLIAGHFGRLSLIAPLPNILIVPFLFAPMLMSLAIGILAIALQTTAVFFTVPLLYSLSYILWIVKIFDKVPFASLEFSKPDWWLVGVGYSVLIGILFFIYKKCQNRLLPV